MIGFVLYFIGLAGILVTAVLVPRAPMISAGGIISAFLLSFALIGIGRLIDQMVAIERNTRRMADLLDRQAGTARE